MEQKTERVAIFIDGSNFYHSVKDTLHRHDNEIIDFRKLVEILRGNATLIGVFYYNAPLDRKYNPQVYSKQQRFFAELRRLPGFTVTLCPMRKGRKPDGTIGYVVKGDDIHIATDMLSGAYENMYDIAILVSGDGDFVPLIRKVQKLGKKVENAYFEVSRSDALRQTCDKSINLGDIINECMKERRE